MTTSQVRFPAWLQSLVRQLKERENDDALTPCRLTIPDAYACVEQFTALSDYYKPQPNDIPTLKTFYQVETLEELIAIQAKHIERLQNAHQSVSVGQVPRARA